MLGQIAGKGGAVAVLVLVRLPPAEGANDGPRRIAIELGHEIACSDFEHLLRHAWLGVGVEDFDQVSVGKVPVAGTFKQSQAALDVRVNSRIALERPQRELPQKR